MSTPHRTKGKTAMSNEFLPNTVGQQQADAAASIAAAERSLTARINTAVAAGNAAPLWRGPNTGQLAAKRAAAHERLKQQNIERQKQD